MSETDSMTATGAGCRDGKGETTDAKDRSQRHRDRAVECTEHHAGTEAADAAEMTGVVEEGTVDDDFAADDECVELTDDGEQGVVVEGGVDGDLMAGLSQEVVEDGVGVVCDEDSHNEVAI